MTRSIAFYLPQFHAIPENDRWWGEGFTDWRNTAKAQPRFDGHYQPHVPRELGYYDLRDAESRAAQAKLAATFGVDSFCYYHYWFGGRRLLEQPFDAVLESGDPTLPFSLCWANEAWTRSWSGGGEVLVEQRYDREDDLAHIRWLATAFADPRYLRVDGKPLFLVYRAGQLPDAPRTTDLWRAEASRLGIGELYLARVESFRSEHTDPGALGFDAAVEFQPDWRNIRRSGPATVARRVAKALHLTTSALPPYTTFDYDELVATALARPQTDYVRYPCVVPGWDNSPRRRDGAVVVVGSDPDRYEHWLDATLARDPELVFVNAWNEWGEGAHLEPCEHWGLGYLEAHRRAMDRHEQARS
jgi:lipopolysaccharide biosynthesis protein